MSLSKLVLPKLMKTFIKLSILLLFNCSYYAVAQTSFGPRLTAMGNNGAAVKDIWSTEANAAGITGINLPTIALNYTKYLLDNELSKQAIAFVLPLKNNFLGVSFQRYGITQYNEIKGGLAIAKKFGDNLSLSLKGNYHQISIANYGATTAFSVDVGAMYKLNEQLTFGFYINNPAVQKYGSNQVQKIIPTVFHLGSAYYATDKLLLASTLSKDLHASIDFSLGIDYKIIDLISLRAGLSAKPFKHYAGFGINYRKLMVDFAVENDPNLNYTPQIALAYAF